MEVEEERGGEVEGEGEAEGEMAASPPKPGDIVAATSWLGSRGARGLVLGD